LLIGRTVAALEVTRLACRAGPLRLPLRERANGRTALAAQQDRDEAHGWSDRRNAPAGNL